jgi:hypothetical protein
LTPYRVPVWTIRPQAVWSICPQDVVDSPQQHGSRYC